jgi:hypothetical protein
MTRKNAEAHLAVIMALRTKLSLVGITLEDTDNFPLFLLRYKPNNQVHGLFHTGERSIVFEAEIPLRGSIILKTVTLPLGRIPLELLAEFEVLLSSAWQAIGGHMKDLT